MFIPNPRITGDKWVTHKIAGSLSCYSQRKTKKDKQEHNNIKIEEILILPKKLFLTFCFYSDQGYIF
jgi:hypothetical protein